ncbi:MAG: hypothetical protein H3C43_13060 [Leptonema sp. (in: Bacteria)]|nr:hypothetical protein [Leptonema sp. (in: bacteria)]
MDIRTSPQLGMKNVDDFKPLKQGPNVENPASIAGTDTSNRQRMQEDQAASAVRPQDAQTIYKVEGAFIDTHA